jgi:glycosyltransferase involved in cell wall biosynthesis
MSSEIKPLVSIILPVYNGEKHLSESLQSCIGQTYKNLEIIIVNDCSTDTSLSIAESFAKIDARVTVINNKINKRLPASLNVGHNAAKGSLLSWTSDDNFYHPNAIETLVKTLEHSQASIAVSAYNMIESDGELRRVVNPAKDTHITIGNCVGASFLYSKEVFTRNKGYGEELHMVEDYDFWLRSSLHSSFIYIPEVLYSYRIHKESLTAQIDDSSLLFEGNLLKSYISFFETINTPELANYFYRLHRNKPLQIVSFLNKLEGVSPVILSRVSEHFDGSFSNFDEAIDAKMRFQMLVFNENQNIRTLFKIIFSRSRLLYGYERKRSLNYIFKCLF